MQPTKNKTNTQNKKKLFILLGIVIVLLVAAFFLWKHFSNRNDDFSGTAGISKINYGPPTDEEQEAANTQKDKNVEQQDIEDNPKPSAAEVVVTDASYYSDSGKVEIRGYVANVFEDDGTCTVTITKGSQTVTRTSTAFKAATNTQCGAIDIPRSEFADTGTWNVTLAYTSSNSTGEGKATLRL